MINSRHCTALLQPVAATFTQNSPTITRLCQHEVFILASRIVTISSSSHRNLPAKLTPIASWCLFWLFSIVIVVSWPSQGWDADPISVGIELIARKWAVAGSDGGIRRPSARIDETRDQGWLVEYSLFRSGRGWHIAPEIRVELFLSSSSHKCRIQTTPFIQSGVQGFLIPGSSSQLITVWWVFFCG